MNRSRGAVVFDNGKSIAATRLSQTFVVSTNNRNDLSSESVEPRHNVSLVARNFPAIWPFIFALNLWLPVILAASVVRETGWLGISVGVIGLLVLTLAVGILHAESCKRLLVGGGLVGALQLFPVLHIVAGTIGFNLAIALRGALPPTGDSDPGSITSETGGFVCSMMAGVILVGAAYFFGWFLLMLGLQLGATTPERIDEPADAHESPS